MTRLKTHAVRHSNDPVHLAQHRFFNQLAVDHNKPGASRFERGDYSTSPHDLVFCRRKHLVQRGDLLGMYCPFAKEPKLSCLFCRPTQTIRIVEIDERHVDGVKPGTGRSMHHARPRVEYGSQLFLQHNSAAMSTAPKNSASMRGEQYAIS